MPWDAQGAARLGGSSRSKGGDRDQGEWPHTFARAQLPGARRMGRMAARAHRRTASPPPSRAPRPFVRPPAASVFAAAASVAKARCEIDFAATNAAASELAYRSKGTEGGPNEQDFLRPLISVRKLIATVARSIWFESKQRVSRALQRLSSLLGGPRPPGSLAALS